MTRRDALAGLAMGTAALTLGGCLFRPVHSFRFRVTVEVDTIQGLRSGLTVMEMSLSQGMAIGDSSGVSSRLIGEAVAVDLPGGTLFMLLEDVMALGGIKSNVIRTFFPGVVGPKSVDAAKTLGRRGQIGHRVELPKRYYPTFAHFGDPLQPSSIEKVDFSQLQSHFSSQPVLRGVFFEVTRQQLTHSIKRRLPWIDDFNGSLSEVTADSGSTEMPFGRQVTRRYLRQD